MNNSKKPDRGENRRKRTKNTVKLDISVYGRESVIHIGKDVLRVLGAPENVCLKVSRRLDSFVVMPCEERVPLSFRVPDDFIFNSRKQMRVTSRSFVAGLLAMNDLEIGHTYKLSGTYSEKNNAVIFNMSDIRRYRE